MNHLFRSPRSLRSYCTKKSVKLRVRSTAHRTSLLLTTFVNSKPAHFSSANSSTPSAQSGRYKPSYMPKKLWSTIAAMTLRAPIRQDVLWVCNNNLNLPSNLLKACSTTTRAELCTQLKVRSGPVLEPISPL